MLVLQAGAVFRNQKPVDVPRSAMLDLNLPISPPLELELE